MINDYFIFLIKSSNCFFYSTSKVCIKSDASELRCFRVVVNYQLIQNLLSQWGQRKFRQSFLLLFQWELEHQLFDVYFLNILLRSHGWHVFLGFFSSWVFLFFIPLGFCQSSKRYSSSALMTKAGEFHVCPSLGGAATPSYIFLFTQTISRTVTSRNNSSPHQ